MAGGAFNPGANQRRVSVCHRLLQIGSDGFWNGDDPLTASLPLFLLQITVMMATSRLIYFLLRPLKQPRVVAEILAGIVLGPSGLGRYKSWSDTLSPSQGEKLIRTAGLIGMCLFLFLTGVKMDSTLMFKSGKKPLAIAVVGTFVPIMMCTVASFALMSRIPADIAKGSFLMFFPASLSVTAFPNLAPMLGELDLLNSELGQLALSSALVNDCIGWFFMALFTAIDQAQGHPTQAIWAMTSIGACIAAVFLIFRPWTQWVIKSIPRGGHVQEGYVVSILVGSLVSAFLTDFTGANIAIGPLFMGLAIPDGPPLGSALIERSEFIVMEVLLPLLFFMCGMSIDLSVLYQWRRWGPLVVVIFVGYMGKLLGTMVSAMYCKMYIGSSFILGLIMSFRGIIEVCTFLNWWTGGLLDNKSFTVAVLCTTVITAIVTPLVAILYDPFSRGGSLAGQTVERTRPNTELRILTCVHTQEAVPSVISLLTTFQVTTSIPMCVYALHLVELVGRAAPLFISHKTKHDLSDPILNAFVNYEQRTVGCVIVQPFTTVSPYKTMHQDICKVAEDKAVALVVIPFRRKETPEATISKADQALRTMTPILLSNSPCSVGILIHNSDYVAEVHLYGQLAHHVVVVFWGGPDDREALAVGSRMAGNEGVSVTVMRYIQLDNRGDEWERRLDDEALREFGARNMKHNTMGAKVTVKEVVVTDMAQTLNSIRLMGGIYDLILVGRQPQTLLEELSEWSECPELGMLGDLFASLDNDKPCSALVVQQCYG